MQLIIKWQDTGRMTVREFATAEELVECASIAVMLRARVCWQLSNGEWVWS